MSYVFLVEPAQREQSDLSSHYDVVGKFVLAEWRICLEKNMVKYSQFTPNAHQTSGRKGRGLN